MDTLKSMVDEYLEEIHERHKEKVQFLNLITTFDCAFQKSYNNAKLNANIYALQQIVRLTDLFDYDIHTASKYMLHIKMTNIYSAFFNLEDDYIFDAIVAALRKAFEQKDIMLEISGIETVEDFFNCSFDKLSSLCVYDDKEDEEIELMI